MTDEYYTISKNSTFELKEKGSKFIALTYQIYNSKEAEEIIQKNKKIFYDATHNCFAYRFGLDGNNFRFNDDGEPSGSAGKPILNAIDQLNVTDVLVIVNRYFGGTKLGIPGLIRAYHDSAYEALKDSSIIKKIITKEYLLTFDHNQINTLMHFCSKNKIQIVEQNYNEKVDFKIAIRLSHAEKYTNEIFDLMNGKIEIKEVDS